MLWECSECGSHVEAYRRPRCCENCGVAGVIFVEAEQGLEGDDTSDCLTAAWLERGMNWRRGVVALDAR